MNQKTHHVVPPLPEHRLRILLSEEKVDQRIRELRHQLTADYRELDPVVIAVLKGSFIFVADLIRGLEFPLTTEFMRVSSYGNQVVTTGEVKLELDIACSVSNRHVLLVEDIVDTGLTLEYLKATLEVRRPASLKVCALLHKPSNNVKISNLEYVGFNIPNEFVVGYGLDYQGYYRNLPYIAQLELL
ncbi:MAG: hypoxanthine phosphoribosyltransferase [Planctomycetes bacterium]|nr:hypoxanthine phosphoribosyltransferase [Planctomycetota bacterium]